MSRARRLQGKASGFTLLELLVVISIVALLLSILLPCLDRVKEHAKRTSCQNNLHQGLILVHMYAGDHDGFLPEGDYIVYYDRDT